MRLFSLLAVLGLAIGLVISGEAPVQPGSAGARRRDETAPRGSAALHFGTLNVLSAASKTQTKPGYGPWAIRRRALVGSVIRSGADIVGFQDATAKQARDIQAGLRSKYGCRRTETGTKAENMMICHKKSTVTVEKKVEKVELRMHLERRQGESQSPTVQLGEYKLTATGEAFWAANAHFDAKSEKIREDSAKSLLDSLRDKIQGTQTDYRPLVVVLGNLNIKPDDDAYHVLTGERYLTKNEDLRRIKPDTFFDLQRSAGDDLTGVTYKQGKLREKREENDYHMKEVVDYVLAADSGAVADDCWKIGKVQTVGNTFRKKGRRVKYSDHKLLLAALRKGG